MPGSHHFDAFRVDGPSQDGCRRRPVASHVRRFAGHFFDHLGTHILEPVFKLDLFGDGDTVFCHYGCAERSLNNHVPALGAEGHCNGVSQDVDAPQCPISCILTEFDKLGHMWILLHIPRIIQPHREDRLLA